jgi:hypothetical protein
VRGIYGDEYELEIYACTRVYRNSVYTILQEYDKIEDEGEKGMVYVYEL